MKIRAITIGDNIPYLDKDEDLQEYVDNAFTKFQKINEDLVDRFKGKGLEVQSRRICSQPLFPNIKKNLNKDNIEKSLEELNTQFQIIIDSSDTYDINYVACCSMLADRLNDFGDVEKEILNEIPRCILNHDSLFSSINVASTKRGINLSALKASTKVIKKLSSDPFKNLNFCVSSNVTPDLNIPFFPASYHSSKQPGFSLALEMADEVIKICEESEKRSDIKKRLHKKFLEIYEILVEISENIASKYEIEFKGIDFSPAPFPKLETSIGNAVEQVGFDYFGAHGCTFGVALIKNAIPTNLEKVIGFSGFMQPVLEDFTISKRVSENKLNLDTLLLYSCLCGTGLDCIPLPGSITEKELFYMLLDICSISLQLDKPLTARLMPIPGKKAGETVEFDFEYFAKSKIFDYKHISKEFNSGIYEQDETFITL